MPSLCNKPGLEHMEKPPTFSTPGMKKSTLQQPQHVVFQKAFNRSGVINNGFNHSEKEEPGTRRHPRADWLKQTEQSLNGKLKNTKLTDECS